MQSVGRAQNARLGSRVAISTEPKDELIVVDGGASLWLEEGLWGMTTTKLGHRRYKLIELPTDIHVLLFEYIDDYVDAICFSQTCHHLWVIGQRRVVDLVAGFLASWAGDGVVCLANTATGPPPSDDIPLDVRKAAAARPNSGLIICHFRRNLSGVVCFTPLEDEESHISNPETRQQIRACCLEIDAMDADLGTSPQSRKQSTISTSTNAITNKLRKWSKGINSLPFRQAYMSTDDRRWVLPNPTTGECVTIRGIATYPRYVHDTHLGGMTCLLSLLMYRMSKAAMGW
jgi:hypothetical protein